MSNEKPRKFAEPGAARPSASQLQQEVQFWRDMLAATGMDKHSRESVERMKQALALAEYRLSAQTQKIHD